MITHANIQNFCRLCLRELPIANFKPNHNIEDIFELIQNIAGISLSMKFKKECGSKVLYPNKVCHCCYIKMIALSTFRDKCIMGAGVIIIIIAEDLTETAIQKLQNFCRACLKCTDDLDWDEETAENLVCLEQCIGIRVADDVVRTADKAYPLLSDHRFPQKLCSKCTSKLKTFITFKDLARNSEEYLRNLFDDNGEEIDYEFGKDLIRLEEKFQTSIKDGTSLENITNIKIENSYDEDNLKNPLGDISIYEECVINKNNSSNEVMENSEALAKDNSKRTIQLIKDTADLPTSRKTISQQRKVRKNVSYCPQCKKKFHKDFILEAHIKSAHEGIDRPFICKLCPRSFKQNFVLNRHINLLHKPKVSTSSDVSVFASPKKKVHICFLCLKQFKRKDIFRHHMNNVHISSRELLPFKCKFCEKGFGSEKSMLRHEANHSNERPFACEYCPKRYNRKFDLFAHIERHITNPELLCPICKRAKSSIEELEKHIANHEKSRQNQCTKCGLVFTKINHLKEHDSSVHLKLRPFKCTYCEKDFATQRTKKEHELMHDSRARPFPCLLCTMNFRTQRGLSVHTTQMHNKTSKKRL